MACCPPAAELEQFLEEGLPPGQQQEVANHLTDCQHCEQVLEDLTASNDPRFQALGSTASCSLLGSPTESLVTEALPSAGHHVKPPSPPGYIIVREIGRGGMGVVYLARQRGLERVVALKMILAGAHANPEQTARFLAEARIAAGLRHPNIVQVHEVGQHGGSPFFVLEYVEGGNLAELLARKPHPPRASAALVEQLARAVHHAHRTGVIHRDLKPANILLAGPPRVRDEEFRVAWGRGECTPMITDFGLAKHLEGGEGLTPSHAVLGTPQYMAPEQATGGQHVGPAADVYALGAILYECLTGRPPFLGANPIETTLQVINQDPVTVNRLQPAVPRDLATVCMKCLEKEPSRRYGTARELASDLARFLGGHPVAARPVSAPVRAARWARRSPLVASLAVTLAILGATLFGMVLWQRNEATRRATLAEANERREKATRREMERLSAGLILEQGVTLCDRGDVGPGLLTLVVGLDRAIQAEDADLERLARLQLSTWQNHLIRPAARLRHSSNVTSVAYSRDGKLAASGSRDGTVRVWNAENGEPVSPLIQHAYPVFSLAFSPDGRTLVTGSGPEERGDGEVCFWEVPSGKQHQILRQPESVVHVAFSEKGDRILAVSPAQVAILHRQGTPWQVQHALQHPAGTIWAGTLSPDGKKVLTGGTAGARVWDADTGEQLLELKDVPTPNDAMRRPPSERVMCVAFSPDGRRAFTGDSYGVGRLWDAATGRRHGVLMVHRGMVKAVAFSSTGETLATGSALTEYQPLLKRIAGVAGEARVWDANGHAVSRPLAHSLPVWSVALARRGQLLATGCEDGHARVFLAASGALVNRPLRHTGTVRQLAFSPDATGLIGAGDGGGPRNGAEATLWRLPTKLEGKILLPTQMGASCRWLAIGPRGDRLLAWYRGAISVSVQDILLKGDTARLDLSSIPKDTILTAGAISTEGHVAMGTQEGVLRLWEGRTGRLLWTRQTEGAIGHLAFDPQGSILACATEGGQVGLWRTKDGQMEGERLQHPAEAWVSRFTPDGNSLWTVSSDHTVRRWDLKRGVVAHSWNAPGELTASVFRPDGQALLSASAQGRRVQLRELETGRPEGPPLSHPTTMITCLAFSKDGRFAVTGGGFEAMLWDLRTQRRVGPTLLRAGAVMVTDFHPEGRSFFFCGDCPLTQHEVPDEMPGSPERLRVWAEVLTGQRRDDQGIVYDLTPAEAAERQRLLRELDSGGEGT